MPRSNKSPKIDIRYVLTTYILGLYGGLVSGLVVSWATRSPSIQLLWIVGILLVAIGIILFVVINKFLGGRK